MRKNKKGTDAATSVPNRESTLLEIYRYYSNTILKICLFLISAGLVLLYVGAYVNNEIISVFGLGVGAAGGIIQARINTEDE